MNYMKTNKDVVTKAVFWIVIVLAILIRVVNLSSVPPHLTPDEAALGYNAYSILKTGRDEHGAFLPIVFKSFGDYKPGLYVYLTVPFVGLMGLNEFSVRFPSALMGIISIYLLYLISKKIFSEDKNMSLLVMAVAAFNPWLIYFSRGAWEVNFSLTLTLAGIYFFLLSLDKNKYLFLSALFFGLTMLAYQGAKLSTGIVVLLLGFIYHKEIFKYNLKTLAGSAALGLLVVSPILGSLFTGQSGRLEVFSIFSYPRSKEYITAMLNEGGEKIGDGSYLLFHNEPYNFLRGILGRWFNHFSGRFLFFEGDFSNPRHSAPYQGMLLMTDIVFLLLGFFSLAKGKISKEKLFIILWLAFASLPAVLSRDQVHAVRSLNMAIPLVFVISFGYLFVLKTVSSFGKIVKGVLLLTTILLSLSGITYFIDSYFVHLPVHNSKLWEYGYKQIVETITPIQKNYKRIVVQQSFAQPYIYFLFYQKYDPAKYQKEDNFVNSEYKFDVGYVTKLDNIYFEGIDWSRNRGDHGTLFVADTLRIPPLDSNDPKEFNLVKEIKYKDNLNTAFRILEVKNK